MPPLREKAPLPTLEHDPAAETAASRTPPPSTKSCVRQERSKGYPRQAQRDYQNTSITAARCYCNGISPAKPHTRTKPETGPVRHAEYTDRPTWRPQAVEEPRPTATTERTRRAKSDTRLVKNVLKMTVLRGSQRPRRPSMTPSAPATATFLSQLSWYQALTRVWIRLVARLAAPTRAAANAGIKPPGRDGGGIPLRCRKPAVRRPCHLSVRAWQPCRARTCEPPTQANADHAPLPTSEALHPRAKSLTLRDYTRLTHRCQVSSACPRRRPQERSGPRLRTHPKATDQAEQRPQLARLSERPMGA